jgi:hypothetical protein
VAVAGSVEVESAPREGLAKVGEDMKKRAKAPKGPTTPVAAPARSPARHVSVPTLRDDDVLGDLIDSDFDVRVDKDGKVRVHSRCGDGNDPQVSSEKARFLIEALGADFFPVPDLPR